jgi:RNA polymerase sigma factor FliA
MTVQKARTTLKGYKMTTLLVELMDKEALLNKHMPLVKMIAYSLVSRLPNHLQIEDLCQMGLMGLLDASTKYDPTKGASFETYASIRIRGMMLDELRRLDFVPRSVYKSLRDINETIKVLTVENKITPKDEEVAQRMHISVDSYHKLLQDYHASQTYAFEDLGLDCDLMVSQAHFSDPVLGADRENFCEELIAAIEALSPKEQLVLSLYHDQELNLKEIAKVLEVTESRVCQIHSQAMLHLRSRLKFWAPIEH